MHCISFSTLFVLPILKSSNGGLQPFAFPALQTTRVEVSVFPPLDFDLTLFGTTSDVVGNSNLESKATETSLETTKIVAMRPT